MVFENFVQGGREYLEVLQRVPIHYLLLAVVTYYVSVFLYALRWKIILDRIGKRLPLSELLKIFMASIFINNVTPTSRSGGEILRITWVSKKARLPLGVSAAGVVYERLLEAIPFLFLMIFAGLYVLPSKLPLLMLLLLAVGIIWFKWDLFVNLLLKATKTQISQEGMKELARLRGSALVTVGGIALSTGVWVLDVVRFKLITMAFGLSLPWGLLFAISVVNMLLGLMSVTPGGVGIMEGGLVGVMVHFGIPPLFAVPITLLERFISYVLSTLVGLGVFLLSGGSEIWRALKSR